MVKSIDLSLLSVPPFRIDFRRPLAIRGDQYVMHKFIMVK